MPCPPYAAALAWRAEWNRCHFEECLYVEGSLSKRNLFCFFDVWANSIASQCTAGHRVAPLGKCLLAAVKPQMSAAAWEQIRQQSPTYSGRFGAPYFSIDAKHWGSIAHLILWHMITGYGFEVCTAEGRYQVGRLDAPQCRVNYANLHYFPVKEGQQTGSCPSVMWKNGDPSLIGGMDGVTSPGTSHPAGGTPYILAL